MGAPQPVLGFPSKSAAVEGLQAQGMSDAQIARVLGVGAGTVAALRSSRQRSSGLVPVMVPRHVLDALAAPASARGFDRPEIARRLLAVIARDGLSDAILDDGEG